jgi:hypothetical protein
LAPSCSFSSPVVASKRIVPLDKSPDNFNSMSAITKEGAKRFVKEGYLDDIDGLIIGEPTDNGVFYAHKGSMASMSSK